MKLWPRIKVGLQWAKEGVVVGATAVKDAAVFVATDVAAKAERTGDVVGATGRMIRRDVGRDPVAVAETTEVIDAALEMVAVAKRVGRDGWQFADVGLIITDKHLMETIQRALSGAEKIPDELSKLSLSETLGLAMSAMDGLKRLGK